MDLQLSGYSLQSTLFYVIASSDLSERGVALK